MEIKDFVRNNIIDKSSLCDIFDYLNSSDIKIYNEPNNKDMIKYYLFYKNNIDLLTNYIIKRAYELTDEHFKQNYIYEIVKIDREEISFMYVDNSDDKHKMLTFKINDFINDEKI